jgi:hypothetical protein
MKATPYYPTAADVAFYTREARAETAMLRHFRTTGMRRDVARKAAHYGLLAMGLRPFALDLTEENK